jgi:cell wall-associated NlpC family hydrolase
VALCLVVASHTLSYSGSAAAAYADTWALSNNPNYPNYGDDCTNFVSQALHAGGYPFHGTNGSTTNYHNWFMSNTLGWWNYSHTWTVAPDLLNFLYYDSPGGSPVAYKAPYQGSSSGASNGDVIFYDWGDGKGVSHDAIQVGYGTDPSSGWVGTLVDAHNTDHYHAIWHLRPYNANLAALTYITVAHVSTSN